MLSLGAGQQATESEIAGIVLRTGSTEPIPRAEVTLTRGGQIALATRTDDDGRFSFSGLVPGTYTIRIQRDGFFGSSASSSTQRLLDTASLSMGIALGDQTSTAPTTGTIEVAASEKRTGLIYYLTQGSILTGQVLRNGGTFPGATVTALKLTYRSGQRSLIPAKTAIADDRGNFRIAWLAAGEYFIRADATRADERLRGYHPRSDSPGRSVVVKAEEGREHSGIDVFLSDAPQATLFGTVTNLSIAVPQATTTQRTARFVLVPTDRDAILDGPIDVVSSVENPADRLEGKFEIRDVRPGIYDLVAIFSERVPGATQSNKFPVYTGRTRVVVGNEDLRGVSLTLSREVEVQGRLILAGNDTLPAGRSYRVWLRAAGMLSPITGAYSNLSVFVRPDGTFTISGVPQLPYSVTVTGMPDDAFITDLRQDGRSVFGDGVFNIDSPSTNIEVRFNAPGGTVDGKVTFGSQQPSSRIAVVLAPLENQANPILYRRVAASAAGVFSVTGVAPGRYRAFAFENLPETAELNTQLLAGTRDSAVEITATGGDTTTIELNLIRMP